MLDKVDDKTVVRIIDTLNDLDKIINDALGMEWNLNIPGGTPDDQPRLDPDSQDLSWHFEPGNLSDVKSLRDAISGLSYGPTKGRRVTITGLRRPTGPEREKALLQRQLNDKNLEALMITGLSDGLSPSDYGPTVANFVYFTPDTGAALSRSLIEKEDLQGGTPDTSILRFEPQKSMKKQFQTVTFTPGREYRFRPERKLTEGIYARYYPKPGESDSIDYYLGNVVTYRASGRPGHVNHELGLNAIDIANFGRSYPAVKKAITNASSGFYETMLELVIGVPILLTKKVRKAITAGTTLAKFAKAYLAWELAIWPSLQSMKAAKHIRLEDLQTFSQNGFSVYRAKSTAGYDGLDVQPVDEGPIKEFFINLVKNNPSTEDMATVLADPPREVRDAINLREETIFISDYDITLHIGDVLGMSLERQYVLKHGGHLALLAYDLSPISFFTDWFTHVYKSLMIDVDMSSMDHLYKGTYSNKLTVLEPARGGNAQRVSNMFYRKAFDPITVPAITFENAFRQWTNSAWRTSIIAAIVASASPSKNKRYKGVS